jgi:hypothetical protein
MLLNSIAYEIYLGRAEACRRPLRRQSWPRGPHVASVRFAAGMRQAIGRALIAVGEAIAAERAAPAVRPIRN